MCTRPARKINSLHALLLLLILTSTNLFAQPEIGKANSAQAIKKFKSFLSESASSLSDLSETNFAKTPLTKSDAQAAFAMLWKKEAESRTEAHLAEWKEKIIKTSTHEMKFDYRVFGEKPEDGWSLFISMHGGGGAPTELNDSQWRNQIKLYQPDNAIYVAPRAPTDAWNLWHQAHIDPLFDRLIEGAILTKGVNPNKVYIMGYSAGGDGVYQLAPRMADRLAGAAMMAGHPNDASPLGLRNIGFSIDVGALDAAYKRNKIAGEWKIKLDALEAADPEGYKHQVHVREGMGHWMNRKDAESVKWIAQFTRNPYPEKIVWKQDGVTHSRFYWLSVPKEQEKKGVEIVAERKGQKIDLTGGAKIENLTILLNDKMFDLDKEITVTWEGKEVFRGQVPRTLEAISRTLHERMDPAQTFCAEISVDR